MRIYKDERNRSYKRIQSLQPNEWTYRDWLNSEARYLLNQIPSNILEYVRFEDMTSEEKAAHPEKEF